MKKDGILLSKGLDNLKHERGTTLWTILLTS